LEPAVLRCWLAHLPTKYAELRCGNGQGGSAKKTPTTFIDFFGLAFLPSLVMACLMCMSKPIRDVALEPFHSARSCHYAG
jgi:hypothetical protein